MTLEFAIIISLGIVVSLLVLAIRNLIVKIEKYEDITVDQTQYLQRISEVIRDSQKRLKEIDAKGAFESDDEVGYFFKQLKTVQQELDLYMLPENYGEKEIE